MEVVIDLSGLTPKEYRKKIKLINKLLKPIVTADCQSVTATKEKDGHEK